MLSIADMIAQKNISQRLSAMRTTWYRMQSFAIRYERRIQAISIFDSPALLMVGWLISQRGNVMECARHGCRGHSDTEEYEGIFYGVQLHE